jgi:hypothetical protein
MSSGTQNKIMGQCAESVVALVPQLWEASRRATERGGVGFERYPLVSTHCATSRSH